MTSVTCVSEFVAGKGVCKCVCISYVCVFLMCVYVYIMCVCVCVKSSLFGFFVGSHLALRFNYHRTFS